MNTTRTWWIVAASLACSIGTADADGMIKNGLSSWAFGHNALTVNPTAVTKLTTSKLNDELFADPYIAKQLADVNAQAVMTEIVRCALPASATFNFTDPEFGANVVFKGELGICSNTTTPAGDWTAAPPSTTCLQLVTSCVAARVNGVGRSVPLSMRSQDASVPPTHTTVETDTTYRAPVMGDPGVGTTISSFNATALSHWVTGFDGTCTANASVALQGGSGACHVRVCTSIAGCLGSGVTPPGGVQIDSTFRAEGNCASPNKVTFQCPSSGSFTTMFQVIRFAAPPTVQAIGAIYPAAETKVFDKLEGAFYGNMFDGALVNYRCEFRDGERYCDPLPACGKTCDGTALPFNHVYGCFSSEIAHDDDVYGEQYTQDRICGRTARCFAHAPARCHYGADNDNQTKGSHCTKSNGVFGTCFDPTGTDLTPYDTITTYLNGGCDLVSLTQCNALNPKLAAEIGGPVATPVEDVEDDDGGCSVVGQARGGVVTLLLALVALVLARRSRRSSRHV